MFYHCFPLNSFFSKMWRKNPIMPIQNLLKHKYCQTSDPSSTVYIFYYFFFNLVSLILSVAETLKLCPLCCRYTYPRWANTYSVKIPTGRSGGNEVFLPQKEKSLNTCFVVLTHILHLFYSWRNESYFLGVLADSSSTMSGTALWNLLEADKSHTHDWSSGLNQTE